MEVFLKILKHSAKHTFNPISVLVLFAVYFLIELLEYKNVLKFENSKLLKGNASPVFGACFGVIPQCSFSVISSELYAEKKISIAALIAVFISTSDEAIPIMVQNYKNIPSLLMLILVKVIIAIVVGYITMALYKAIFKKQNQKTLNNINSKALSSENNSITKPQQKNDFDDIENNDNKIIEHNHDEHDEHKHKHDEHEQHEHSHIHACCHHDVENTKFDWKHPIVHSLKILAYIFIFNMLMNGFVELVGQKNIENFLITSSALQPLVALVVGLIPNCFSSVVLTQLYLAGGLSFGAIITGLSVNAGLGLLVLFKENKNIKENLFIVAILVISSLAFGYLFHFLPFDFLKI